MNKFLFAFVIVFFNSFSAFSVDVDFLLAGKWTYRLDSMSIGEQEHWEKDVLTSPIYLPGSTDEAGIGDTHPLFKSILGCAPFPDYPSEADFGMVTRRHKYIGKVWYQREFEIPEGEEGAYTLFLERVLWRSRVWIDGKPVDGVSDYLSSPHRHFLGMLGVGKHLLTVMVDNDEIYPIGTLGHSYCPHMQTQWNGIVGKIGLLKIEDGSIRQVDVFPSLKEKKVRIAVELNQLETVSRKVSLRFSIVDKQTQKSISEAFEEVELTDKNQEFACEMAVPAPKPWDEFEPNLYRLDVQVKTSHTLDKAMAQFGFRDLGVEDKHFTINGKKMVYRGSHEGMFFPHTGYPSMDVAYWKKIWALYKEHGFNAVRFHSCCPPEAAFVAADEVGLYMQVEFFWKDGWMGWKDLIGEADERLNQFVCEEVREALRNYGNHPSMMLVAFGNELGGNFDWMGERLGEMKRRDPRHWYAAGIAHDITGEDDFVEYGGKNQAQKHWGTDWDYSENYTVPSAHNYDAQFRRKDLPEFTHETGQYIVHPLWSEIEKYHGALVPLNLEYYRSVAEKNGIARMDEELQKASGQVNKNLYKAEIEATLRTPESAGYSLLSMVDYPGQGEALVGWVNPFYESKGFLAPEEFAMFGTHTVPLLRFDKYVWEDGERLVAKVEIANYGPRSLQAKQIGYTLKEGNRVIEAGHLYAAQIPQGGLTRVGGFSCLLEAGGKGRKIDIELRIEGTPYKNRWSVWVFPRTEPCPASGGTVETRSLEVAIKELKKGNKVLLLADRLGDGQNRVYSSFEPVFWSATWFTGQETDVSGAYVRNAHPALALFPTEDVMDWQWADVCRGSRGFILNDLPKDYFPIVQPVNDFHHGNKLGTLFELRTPEGGRLMVCGYNLTDSLESRVAARQLRKSVLAYMDSEAFRPVQTVSYAWLEANLKEEPACRGQEKERPDALLFVVPGEADASSGLVPWSLSEDRVLVNEDDFHYTISCDGILRNEDGTGWVGKKMELLIEVSHPKLLNLKLRFSDAGHAHRTGTIACEDAPEVRLEHLEEGAWVSIPVTRENCLDGIIRVEINCRKGPDLILEGFALTPQ